jgi:hypothetical protein
VHHQSATDEAPKIQKWATGTIAGWGYVSGRVFDSLPLMTIIEIQFSVKTNPRSSADFVVGQTLPLSPESITETTTLEDIGGGLSLKTNWSTEDGTSYVVCVGDNAIATGKDRDRVISDATRMALESTGPKKDDLPELPRGFEWEIGSQSYSIIGPTSVNKSRQDAKAIASELSPNQAIETALENSQAFRNLSVDRDARGDVMNEAVGVASGQCKRITTDGYWYQWLDIAIDTYTREELDEWHWEAVGILSGGYATRLEEAGIVMVRPTAAMVEAILVDRIEKAKVYGLPPSVNEKTINAGLRRIRARIEAGEGDDFLKIAGHWLDKNYADTAGAIAHFEKVARRLEKSDRENAILNEKPESIQPATKQLVGGHSAKSIAKFLDACGWLKEAFADEDFHYYIQNPPFEDLQVKREGDRLTFSHYRDGDRPKARDGQMEFQILPNGQLVLVKTSADFDGRTYNSCDKSFANLWAKNILEQGFHEEDAQRDRILAVIDPPEQVIEDLTYTANGITFTWGECDEQEWWEAHFNGAKYQVLRVKADADRWKFAWWYALEHIGDSVETLNERDGPLGDTQTLDINTENATSWMIALSQYARDKEQSQPQHQNPEGVDPQAVSTPDAEVADSDPVHFCGPGKERGEPAWPVRSGQEHWTKLAKACEEAGLDIAERLNNGHAVNLPYIKYCMDKYVGGTQAAGAWQTKHGYDAQEMAWAWTDVVTEAAGVVRAWGRMAANAQRGDYPSPQQQDWAIGRAKSTLKKLLDAEQLCATHTRRTEESISYQQFSTTAPLAFLVALASDISESDIFLESSAGTGMLAHIPARIVGAGKMILNELEPGRAEMLDVLYGGSSYSGEERALVYRVNGEMIDDLLPNDEDLIPSVVMINPPFSRSPAVDARNPLATVSHLTSALRRLRSGGRLVLISASWFCPTEPKWAGIFEKLQREATLRLSIGIDGSIYRKHGTHMDVRISVFDKIPANNPAKFTDQIHPELFTDLDSVIDILANMPPRADMSGLSGPEPTGPTAPQGEDRSSASTDRPSGRSVPAQPKSPGVSGQKRKKQRGRTKSKATSTVVQSASTGFLSDAVPVRYEVIDNPRSEERDDRVGIFQRYEPQSVRFPDAQPHPTPLCETSALATIAPPKPDVTIRLPNRLVQEQDGISEAQLEAVLYAAQAHSQYLPGFYQLPAEDDSRLDISTEGSPGAFKVRRGWFLGDGTGVGKGRSVAGIIMSNWAEGRKQAIWLSKSGTLVEDARRDWANLGGDPNLIFSLNKIPSQGDIGVNEGIAFVTYATLRSQSRQEGGQSRLEQLIKWLGQDFDGVIVFDEAHELAGAAISKPSQQGLAGLTLQNRLPYARVIYSSATGAVNPYNLAYASRLGLWQGDFQFKDRGEFINALEEGGVAAMEVLCRDLKALGLYLSRTLSFEGVTYEVKTVPVTDKKREIWNVYSEAFQIIHQNMDEALEASQVVSSTGQCLNKNAKRAALSAFEGVKQRFFEHLLMSIKADKMIELMEDDIANGHAPVIQLVSTNEAVMERRLSEIPPDEWDNLSINVTPLEYILDYLSRSFPTQAQTLYEAEDGLKSRPAFDEDDEPVYNRHAEKLRDELIDKIIQLPPVPSGLDRIIHHFGEDKVAEITGRKRRILFDKKQGRYYVQNRSSVANIEERKAFMDDRKQILIFSAAGGTGASYDADINCANIRLRTHYIYQAGWSAFLAMQGLGRSHRANQNQPPLFRLITTEVRGEKRFISTIARRLNSLGALTRGQREAGGQGVFTARDDMESSYAKTALYLFFLAMVHGQTKSCKVADFQRITGLTLLKEDGGMVEAIPPMNRFLNRVLSLKIEDQNRIFDEFEAGIEAQIEAAIADGSYERGIEELSFSELKVLSREVIYQHKGTDAKTKCIEMVRREKVHKTSAKEALNFLRVWDYFPPDHLYINDRTHRAAVIRDHSNIFDEKGMSIGRKRLMRPTKEEVMHNQEFFRSKWRRANSISEWNAAWTEECDRLPEYKKTRFFLITGLLLPIWSYLKGTQPNIYRLKTDDGEVFLGRILSLHEIDTIKQLTSKVSAFSGIEIAELVAAGGTYRLSNGMSFCLRTVAGDARIELVCSYFMDNILSRLRDVGCFTETIQYKSRCFVPYHAGHSLEKTGEIIDATLEVLGL